MSQENTPTAIVTHKEHHRNPNPFQNLLSLFHNFKLQLTQPKKQSAKEDDPKAQKPGVVVRFPGRPKLPEPIKLHDDDSEATNNHQKSPAVMWQIYAVGAYVIASWAWNQWQKKKKGLKNPSDKDEQNED